MISDEQNGFRPDKMRRPSVCFKTTCWNLHEWDCKVYAGLMDLENSIGAWR